MENGETGLLVGLERNGFAQRLAEQFNPLMRDAQGGLGPWVLEGVRELHSSSAGKQLRGKP